MAARGKTYKDAREKVDRDGLRKPATFDFLGFTHIASVSRTGKFQLKRRTSRKKRREKLARLKVGRDAAPIPAGIAPYPSSTGG